MKAGPRDVLGPKSVSPLEICDVDRAGRFAFGVGSSLGGIRPRGNEGLVQASRGVEVQAEGREVRPESESRQVRVAHSNDAEETQKAKLLCGLVGGNGHGWRWGGSPREAVHGGRVFGRG